MALIDQLQTELGPAYRVDRELSGGGMSRVFVATEISLGRTVVIKLLKPELAADVMSERFAREIQLVARLQQANIVPLIAAGRTSHGPFYTMPFVEGASLRERLSGGAALSIAEAVGILRDVARALAYAHDAGVIHRDIKPENVLLSGGAAVVTDFGIAKALSASRTDASTTITQVGVGMGTPAYMAPEQATGDPSVDHRADIYAFGCLAYELIAGHAPFHDRQAHRAIAAHIAERPAALSSQRPGITPALCSLVDRCLEKDPARRPQSARELLGALDGLATPAVAPVAPRRGTAIATAIAFAVVVLGVGVYAATNRRATSATDAEPALAVIPFVNVGGDSTQDYLADGISDELATAIGKLSGVHLAARSAAYRYHGRRDLDVRELGKTLQARFVLQGTLRRVGEALRISAQLSDASIGQELGSVTLERPTGDVFRTQDTITTAIVKALASHLPSSTSTAARSKPPTMGQGTSDAAAYDHYLRGEYLVRRRQVAPAIESYQAAIARDSTFGRAYAGLSQALALSTYYLATPPDSVRGRVIAAANHALALDSGLARAYQSIAVASMHAWKWTEARAAFEKAVAGDPTDLETRLQFGRFLHFVGENDAAIEQWQHALVIDPFYAIGASWISYVFAEQGKVADATAYAHRAIEYDSASLGVKAIAGMALLASDPAAASALVRRLPTAPPWAGERGWVTGMAGDTADARAMIRLLEAAPHKSGFAYTSLAEASLGARDTTRALGALEHATDAHEPWPTFHAVADHIFDSLRRSARWSALVHRVGLDSVAGAVAR